MSAEMTLIFERGEDGWWVATIPEVPGAFSQGKTRAEARENAIDALQELMSARRELAIKEMSVSSVVESLALTA